jgi:hypothetical protein
MNHYIYKKLMYDMLKPIFFKKIFLYIFVFISLISISSALQYNENYSDLHLEYTHFCANLEIEFTIYNKSEFDNANSDNLDICKEDQDEEDDRCVEYDIISADVTIYDGPFDTRPTIFEGKSDSNSQFKVTYENPTRSLINIKPSGRYNEFEISDFDVELCKGLNKNTSINNNTNNNTNTNNETTQNDLEQIEIIIEKKNETFTFDNNNIILKLDDTNITNSNDINIKKIPHESNIENFLTGVQVNLPSDESYSSSSIQIKEEKNEDYEYKLFYRENNLSEWEQISYNYENQYFLVENGKSGEYVLSKTVIENNQIQNTIDLNNNSQSLMDRLVDSSIGIWLLITLAGIVLIFVVYLIISGNKNKDKNYSSNDFKEYNDAKKKNQEENEKIPQSYNQVYTSALNYVNLYKNKYSKESLKDALKKAACPEDIINKVLIDAYK